MLGIADGLQGAACIAVQRDFSVLAALALSYRKRPLPLGNCHVRPLCGAEFCDSQSDVEQYLDDCIVSCVAVLLDGTE